MAESQLYGYKDIERYLQHEMSEQEMHQFEKALMNDPFLADALEGFSAADNKVAQNHLASIERSVTGNQQSGKVVPLSVQKTRWPRVAAAVITIVTAGALTFSVIKNQRSTDGNEKISASAQRAMVQKDSITAADQPLAGLTMPPETQRIVKPSVSTPLVASESIKESKLKQPTVATAPVASETITNAVPEESTASITGEVKSKDIVPELLTQETSAAEKERLQQVNNAGVDPSVKQVTLSNVMAKTTLGEKTSDTGGRFNNSTGDHAAATANTPGSGKSRIKRTKMENGGTLQEDSSLSLAEVVVGTLSKRKNAVVTIRADSSVAAVPVTGWTDFQQYFNRQLDSLKTTNPMAFEEDIILEFSINTRGRPTNPRLPANLDEAVKEKILQTLFTGPNWKTSKREEKIKIIIAF